MSLNNHVQEPPSNTSTLENCKKDETCGFYNSCSHQDFFGREEDCTDTATEGTNQK